MLLFALSLKSSLASDVIRVALIQATRSGLPDREAKNTRERQSGSQATSFIAPAEQRVHWTKRARHVLCVLPVFRAALVCEWERECCAPLRIAQNVQTLAGARKKCMYRESGMNFPLKRNQNFEIIRSSGGRFVFIFAILSASKTVWRLLRRRNLHMHTWIFIFSAPVFSSARERNNWARQLLLFSAAKWNEENATAEEEKAASAAFEFEQNKAKMILWRAGRQSCVFMFGNALAGIFYSQLPLTMLLSRFLFAVSCEFFCQKEPLLPEK